MGLGLRLGLRVRVLGLGLGSISCINVTDTYTAIVPMIAMIGKDLPKHERYIFCTVCHTNWQSQT